MWIRPVAPLLSLALTAWLAGPARADAADAAATTDTAPVTSVVPEAWPVLPEAVASFGAVSCDGWLYVYSGHRGRVHHHSRDNLSPLFMRLSLRDGRTWEALPPGPPLQGLGLVTHRGRVIRVGGLDARNGAEEADDLHSTAAVAVYDPLSRTWSDLPALPEPRSSLDATVLGDRLYVVGGWSLAGPLAPWLETAWVMDLSAVKPTWERLPPPPTVRRGLAVAAAGGKVWAVGGMTSGGELCDRVEVYDPAAGSWSTGPKLPCRGFGIAAVGEGDDLYVSGQRSGLWRLRAGAEAWEQVTTLALPRYFHRLVPWPGHGLLAVGGNGAGGHLRVCEPLPLGAPEETRCALFELPLPGRAKNRQGVLLRGDALWVVGGNDGLEQHDFRPERFLREGWRIDLGALQVSPTGALPEPRQTLATTILTGPPEARAEGQHGAPPPSQTGLAVGGFGNPGDGQRASRDLFQLSFKTGQWEQLPVTLPTARTQLGLASDAQGRLWVLGGVDYDARRPKAEAFQYPLDVLRWTPGAAQFEVVGKLPRARRAFGCAVLDGKVYLVGGLADGFELVREVDVLDLATNTWTQATPPPLPRISPEMVAFRGKLYVAGGSSPHSAEAGVGEVEEDRSLISFDPVSGRWSTVLPELPVPTRHAQLFAWRERLLLYSPHVEDARAARLLIVDPAPGAVRRP